jgi:hypothetical protein
MTQFDAEAGTSRCWTASLPLQTASLPKLPWSQLSAWRNESVGRRIPPPFNPKQQNMDIPVLFKARLVSTRLDSVYRVYARGNDLYFIQLAGLSTTAQMVTIHFGLVGILIGEFLKRRAKTKAGTILQRAGNQDPEEMLRESKNNFKVYLPEIRDSAIEPPSFFAFHGKQAGRWNFSLRDGKKMRLEFESADELKAALDVLPRLLNATLRVNGEWDETKKRFQKTKPRY